MNTLHARTLLRTPWRPMASVCISALLAATALSGCAPLLLGGAEIGVRGPLAWVSARDPAGRFRAWMWWPDQTDPEGMRKLRLACSSPNAKSAPSLATMQG